MPPAELEALLLTHPAVSDAAVVARADDDAGEVPVAFVVVNANAKEVMWRGGGVRLSQRQRPFV